VAALDAAVRLKLPPLRRLTAFASGFWSGIRRKVNRENIVFV
jgi:hypothetical protein